MTVPPEVDLPRPRGSRRHPVLTDDATGLPNQLHFDVVYRVAFWFGHRGIPVSLLLLEVPGLDDLGTDDARRLGAALAAATRRTDLMARLEGERLAALLLDCNAQGGRVAAERFRSGLEKWAERGRLPFHLGLSAYDASMTGPDDLVAAAERALGVASESGEPGRIEVWPGPRG